MESSASDRRGSELHELFLFFLIICGRPDDGGNCIAIRHIFWHIFDDYRQGKLMGIDEAIRHGRLVEAVSDHKVVDYHLSDERIEVTHAAYKL